MPRPRPRKRRYTTAEQQAEVIAARAAGEAQATVARRLGIAPRTVRDILARAKREDAEAVRAFADAARERVLARAMELLADGILTVKAAEIAALEIGPRMRVLRDLAAVAEAAEGQRPQAVAQATVRFEMPPTLDRAAWGAAVSAES